MTFSLHRTVKMSSSSMNNVIIIGSIFIYISVIIGGLDSKLINVKTVATICQVISIFLGKTIINPYKVKLIISTPNTSTIIIVFIYKLPSFQLQAWLLSAGFVLAFGSMFSKTWRVYRVAALKNSKKSGKSGITHVLFFKLNGPQLPKMKKYIPHMSLPWSL